MNVWGYILIAVVAVTALILLLSVLVNLVVARAARGYSDKTRTRYLHKMQQLLPGHNCGRCGCQSCAEYAYCVFYGKADADRCTDGGPELPGKLKECVEEFEKILEQK